MLSAAAAPAAIFDGWTVTAVSRRRLFFFLFLPPFLLFLLSPYSTAVARPISTRVAATAVVATGTTFSLLFFHWATLERRHWYWSTVDVTRPFFLLSLSLSLSFLSSYIHCCLVLDSLLRLAESIFLFLLLLLLLTSLFSSRFHLCLEPPEIVSKE